jgi:predicted O-methyltransferase YrrM
VRSPTRGDSSRWRRWRSTPRSPRATSSGRASLDSLKQLAEQGAGPFDFVFIDADKENTRPYFEWSLKLSRVGTVIVVDNVVRAGGIADANVNDSQVLGMRKWLAEVNTDKRVDVTAIQTVGSKGYDGFALAYVTEAG